ncbi:hypothetical protein SSX86_007741 [Deinandra increscens subsp. villosa]|uniref:Snakin-1 n=1 Tax=Deinandra increscens subsp. villosa TaxID=3103831 RepID=A0AAP0DIM4_9ASTR
MKPFVSTFMLITFVLLSYSLLPITMAGSSFCDSKCAVRCSKAREHNRCLEYCGMCCEECHCVPSGTYGHKDECPCYRDKKNSRGEPKCP